MDYQAKRQRVIELFPQVLKMNEYEMVALLQQQFNHVDSELPLSNTTVVNNSFRLLTEENEELYEALDTNDFIQFRDAIGDQLTVLYFLLFKINGIQFTGFPKKLDELPENYVVYTDNVKKCHDALKSSLSTQDTALVQKLSYDYLSTLITFPAGSAIDYRSDLLEITIASLSKVCRSEEVAELTLKHYQDLGYSVHIEKSEFGWVVMVSEDCTVKGKLIPKGKFCKSIEWMSPELVPNPDEKAWDATITIWADLMPKAKLHVEDGFNPTIEDKATWEAVVQVYKDLTALKEEVENAKVAKSATPA